MKASLPPMTGLLKAVSTNAVFVLSLLSLSSILGVANAASQCKGLDNSACVANADCGWVDSYQRKDGRDVKAFCRTSSKGKSKKVANSKVEKAAEKDLAQNDTNAS